MTKYHPECTTHEKVLMKIRELKKDLIKISGKKFEEYNRELVREEWTDKMQSDILCRQIVLLQTLSRQTKRTIRRNPSKGIKISKYKK